MKEENAEAYFVIIENVSHLQSRKAKGYFVCVDTWATAENIFFLASLYKRVRSRRAFVNPPLASSQFRDSISTGTMVTLLS